jgi:Do/DeqQ family serine protease
MANQRLSLTYTMLAVLLAVAAGAGGLIGGLAALRWAPRTSAPSPTAPLPGVNSIGEAGRDEDAGFTAVARAALPAVVNIASSRVVRQRELGWPFGPFGAPYGAPRNRVERGLGSGVIVNADGYVITNNHVVQGANEIHVVLTGGKEMAAEMVGTDPKTDIAVIRVRERGLPVLRFGNSGTVQVGDLAFAFGNPYGIGQTMTMGIVSATERGGLGIVDGYEDFIQTDAAINPGNSGGALTNSRGELIGINTAILSSAGGNVGIGFAVPSSIAQFVMEALVKDGKVVRGWLGVAAQPVTPVLREALNLSDDQQGALVAGVAPNSPAARTGLRNGDIIVEIEGEPVKNARELSLIIARRGPGSRTRIVALRDGDRQELTATLGELPEEPAR